MAKDTKQIEYSEDFLDAEFEALKRKRKNERAIKNANNQLRIIGKRESEKRASEALKGLFIISIILLAIFIYQFFTAFNE